MPVDGRAGGWPPVVPGLCHQRAQPRVGIGLRLRHVGHGLADPVPHRRRRVDARGADDRRRRQHQSGQGHRGAFATSDPPRRTSLPQVRQWVRVRVERDPALDDGGRHPTHIAPGKPWQNETSESFNGRSCEECLNMEWFRTRREAAELPGFLGPLIPRDPPPLLVWCFALNSVGVK